jgi:probable rRNA maturation factor
MDPSSSRCPTSVGINVSVEDPSWYRLVRNPQAIVRRAATIAGGGANILLADNATVRRLNARHRGRDKPTNVLTFEPGDIILASGVVAAEAKREGKRAGHHLAHLVIHGMLHLQGYDHDRAGDARAMEMRETRLLARLGVPNPWGRR